jgi:membrane associated rhomboid family serine protease
MNDTLARAGALPIPVILIASVAVVSLLGWLVKPVQRALILNPFRVRERWQVYRLLSAGWVHTDVSHLVFNMLSFYFFADSALRVLGATRFLVLYISAVIMAFVPTTLRHMRNPRYNSLGASGGVAAVMFSAILLNPKLELYVMLIPIPVPAIVFALGYLAYNAWHSYRAGDDVNHDAHFSGAVYGALFTYAFEPTLVERAVKSLF